MLTDILRILFAIVGLIVALTGVAVMAGIVIVILLILISPILSL